MRIRFDRRRRTLSETDIDVAPLMDMVFILLIFFVVTTTFAKETGVELTRPHAVTAEKLQNNSLSLALSSEGGIYYGSNRIDIAEVRGIVTRERVRKNVHVIIIADEMASTQSLIELVDECRIGGAEDVSVATTEVEDE